MSKDTKKYNKILDVTCINCGNRFQVREDRFPICDCGHTIPIIGEKKYARINDDKIPSISIISGDYQTKIQLEKDEQIIEKIMDLSFENEDEVSDILLIDYPEYRTCMLDYTVSEILIHRIMFEKSDVYRALFKAGLTNISRALLHEAKIRSFYDFKQKKLFLNDLNYIDYANYNMVEIRTAIDCRLEGYSNHFRDALIAGKVTVSEFKDLMDSTYFTSNEIVKFIEEYSKVCVYSEDAAKKIKEFSFYIKELNTWFGYAYNPNSPIYTNLSTAELTYNMYKKNGLLAYRKYAAKFNEQYNEYTVGEYTIKLLNAEEVSKMPVGVLPEEALTSPLIGVYKPSTNLISMIANCNGKILISGEQGDTVKSTINKFLDIIES